MVSDVEGGDQYIVSLQQIVSLFYVSQLESWKSEQYLITLPVELLFSDSSRAEHHYWSYGWSFIYYSLIRWIRYDINIVLITIHRVGAMSLTGIAQSCQTTSGQVNGMCGPWAMDRLVGMRHPCTLRVINFFKKCLNFFPNLHSEGVTRSDIL